MTGVAGPAADSAARIIASKAALAAASIPHGDTLTVRIVEPAGGWSAFRHVVGQLGTAVLTVTAGVLVFVLTQALARLAIEPALKVRRVIGRVAHALIFYASTYSNPGIGPDEDMGEAQRALRDLSSELSAAAASVPVWARGLLVRLGIVPAWPELWSAAANLIGLSNGMRGSLGSTGIGNAEKASSIRASLGIA